jgi:hypothetical protein
MNIQSFIKLLLVLVFFSHCTNSYKKNRDFILESGLYNIYSFQNHLVISTKIFSDDSTIIQVCKLPSSNEKCLWEIESVYAKYFKIKYASTNKFLTIINGSHDKLSPVIKLMRETGEDNQLWIIHKYQNEKFKIINKSNKNCLYLPELEKDALSVEFRLCNNKPNEFWYIKSCTDALDIE